MNLKIALLVAVIGIPAATSCRAADGQPTEAQCRTMVDGMLRTMKETPLKTEQDKRGAVEVIERVEKLVRENRKRGVSECESWAAIGHIVVNQ